MSAEVVGGRLLGETESGTLKEVLQELRTLHNPNPPRLGIPGLDEIWKRHGVKLEIIGRALPLLYLIVDTAIEEKSGTIVVVDMDGRFDVSRLRCDLQHVHMFRPVKGALKITLDSIDDYLLYGQHQSKGRELVATIVIGGQGGDIMAGWRGWMLVEREEVAKYGPRMSIEEALMERDARQEAVESADWVASSAWGEYRWKET